MLNWPTPTFPRSTENGCQTGFRYQEGSPLVPAWLIAYQKSSPLVPAWLIAYQKSSPFTQITDSGYQKGSPLMPAWLVAYQKSSPLPSKGEPFIELQGIKNVHL